MLKKCDYFKKKNPSAYWVCREGYQKLSLAKWTTNAISEIYANPLAAKGMFGNKISVSWIIIQRPKRFRQKTIMCLDISIVGRRTLFQISRWILIIHQSYIVSIHIRFFQKFFFECDFYEKWKWPCNHQRRQNLAHVPTLRRHPEIPHFGFFDGK